jgi:hypothetical protein
MSKVLYSIAYNIDKELVNAQDAQKGNSYRCPECNGELILRKSEKTGKGTRRPHFAHKALTPNCTPESVLHKSFKVLLGHLIKSNLEQERSMQMSWNCPFCDKVHTGNLLKKAKKVEIEYNLGVCRPDIALLDENGGVIAVIEIVVSHAPEKSALVYYEKNKIILLQINLESDLELNNLDEKISHPDIIYACTIPRCKECGQFKEDKFMTIIDGECWKCKRPIKAATIYSSGYSLRNVRPSQFSEESIKFAKSKGVIIKSNYSKTTRSQYALITCGHCKAFIGDHYIFTDYISPAGFGSIPSIDYHIGYRCQNCGK